MMIHERAAAFETEGHAGNVDFCQDVARKICFQIDAGGPLHDVRFGTAIVRIHQKRRGIVTVQCLKKVPRKQSRSTCVVKNADPVRIPSLGGLAERRQKPFDLPDPRLLMHRCGKLLPERTCHCGSHKSWQSVDLRGKIDRQIAIVSRKQFVTTVTRERDCHVLTSQLRQVHCRNCRTVRERLVIMPDQFWQHFDRRRVDDKFVVVGPQFRCGFSGVTPFIKLFF